MTTLESFSNSLRAAQDSLRFFAFFAPLREIAEKLSRQYLHLPFLSAFLLFASCGRPVSSSSTSSAFVSSPSKKAATSLPSNIPPQELPKETKQIRICLDPGHGGEDPGARTRTAPFLLEKNLALKTALKTAEQLKKLGYQVYMTRRQDVFIPLPERALFASKKNCHLFVSIHYNSTPKATTAMGPEVYYYDNKNARTIYSKRIGDSIIERLALASKAPSRGVHAADFCVIRETKMPAVLVEVAFLSNKKEASKLRNPTTVQFLGWSIAKGIDDYCSKSKK